MKIPLLILCVAVVYGACQTYGEENFDLTEKIENEDYKLDMPLERFLSRHRRASLLSPITAPINMALRLAGSTGIISTVAKFVRNIFGVLMGLQECPKEGLSISTLVKVITNPFELVNTVLCYILNAIGTQGRALMGKMFDLGIKFFKNIFLPGLHTTLNKINDNVKLPLQIKAMIDTFNIIYKVLQMTGQVPK